MVYGYARFSTEEQILTLQTDALKLFGCTSIITEKNSFTKDRPELNKLLGLLKKNDTVVVWKLDRLGRNLRNLIEIVEKFMKKNINFVSLQDNINTTTASGHIWLNSMGMLAEYERDVIKERTKAGLASARARGRLGGRPSGLTKEATITAMAVYHLYQDKTLSTKEICNQTKVSIGTLYKYVRYMEDKIKNRFDNPA